MLDAASFENKLNELMKELDSSHSSEGERLITLASQTQKLRSQLKEKVDGLQEALDYLKILVKYQLFDLEATRRENQHLRKLLDDKES
ncbi:MAG: hypothetical protein NTW55_02500 [Planctomycetota bacterium]|nr:hypothetical protein [Planctomycetota bacterium]